MLGLPPLVATTVPCIIHLNSLSVKDKDGNILEVQETRLTMFFSHLLVIVSMFAVDALRLLPLPVLYGVFLFMGLSSLGGIQFWGRILMWFMQPSKYPETPFNKYMTKGRVHLYTFLELLMFGLVFFVQNFPTIAIAFPFMTFLCIPTRLFLLPRIFEGWELNLLDGDDIDIEEWCRRKEENDRKDVGADYSLHDLDLEGSPAEEEEEEESEEE